MSLCCCKDRTIKAEKEVLEPEQDQFVIAKKVKAEQSRIEESLQNDQPSDQDMVLVHNLVKRYSTKKSSKKQNSKVETRASEGNSASESE